LSAAGTTQTLYLDGSQVGSLTTSGALVQHRGANLGYIGIGKLTRGWPGGPTATWGNLGFTGQLDEVALYSHPLAATQVGAHYAPRARSRRRTRVGAPVPLT